MRRQCNCFVLMSQMVQNSFTIVLLSSIDSIGHAITYQEDKFYKNNVNKKIADCFSFLYNLLIFTIILQL